MAIFNSRNSTTLTRKFNVVAMAMAMAVVVVVVMVVAVCEKRVLLCISKSLFWFLGSVGKEGGRARF